MNKHIKKELEKCRIKLPEYDDTTTYLLVERNSQLKDLEELKVGHYYLLEVADYIINEYGQQLRFTEKGREWIINLLKENKIIESV